ncbi:MAG: hypothetical protein NZ519_06140 [Bacteroidia bacterium]|nr:hypothetical protein [Bacteroidia bacterium]MDW8301226.1 hypothetical protein [Bacteroidia bacterium]
MEKFQKIYEIVTTIKDDVEKFYQKNNKAAGTRVRKAMQDLKSLAQQIRKEVQEIKNKQEAEAQKSKPSSAKKTEDKKGETKKAATAKASGKKK